MGTGPRIPAGAACDEAARGMSDTLCVEGTCMSRCRSGSKCEPGLACVAVDLQTADPGRSVMYAGHADLRVPSERAPALIEGRQKQFQKGY